MRRLLTRLLRAERALWSLEPRDPRRDLPEGAVARALGALERLGAEPPQALEAEEAAWFERTIRPGLPAWVIYERRLRIWRERWRRIRWERERRRAPGFWSPAREAVFSANAHRAFARLGLAPAEAPS